MSNSGLERSNSRITSLIQFVRKIAIAVYMCRLTMYFVKIPTGVPALVGDPGQDRNTEQQTMPGYITRLNILTPTTRLLITENRTDHADTKSICFRIGPDSIQLIQPPFINHAIRIQQHRPLCTNKTQADVTSACKPLLLCRPDVQSNRLPLRSEEHTSELQSLTNL